ncbi:hepatoma-derived growth factor-related protein 2 [Nilaparvata lugens]|uniref:hepatoma-derived growth factor-related protein 2 n=1 Tax=Nilaparvata lugens TaxID=108931 RepID=UPI00193D5144|nr:hepatoma-derived growth factor-related protein 2 [Nilaparvata lugens]
MSGDSSFGISNVEAALSSSNDSDKANESFDDVSQKTNSQSDLSAAELAKWRADYEKRVNNLLATLGDDGLDQSLPEWTGNSRTSRWRQPRNQNGGGAAMSSEHFNVTENDSIDAVEEEIRSRRRPFSNGQRCKSSAVDVAAAYNDTTDDENAPVVYKKPLPFAQRRQTARKPSVVDPNAFNESHSSVEEERPVRRTRGGFSKRSKPIPNPEFFNSATLDESVVVEAKAKKFTRSARQVTEANMKAFEVTDDEEEEEEDVGGEDEREKETRGGEGDKEGNRATETKGGEEDREGKGTTEEEKGKENTELEEGSEFVLELDEEGSVDKVGEETRNSMDESDESEAEEGGGNKSVSLVIQSDGEVGGEDSLDEEVDEDGEEERKEEKQVVGSAKSGGKGDQNKIQQKNRDGGVGSSNEQSSLLLEYHLSTENHSVVIESHDQSSASLKSSASMTMDITMTSRRSRSRPFTQQFLDMDKTGEGVPNLGKILDGLDVMNMSGKICWNRM